MFVLGITGGIGCGKSTFANFFRELGVKVLDADQISHVVTEKDGSALTKLRTVLPVSCFNEDGSLDRKRVADLVFQNKNLLDKMSLLIHEEVINEILKEANNAKKSGNQLLVLDVPLPVKHGFLDIADYVLVIWAKNDVRIERLAARGLSKADAKQRIACQMTEAEYAQLASKTIDNSASFEELKAQFNDFVKTELNSRGIFL